MKKLFYILAALGCSLTLYAQAPAIQWQKTVGGSEFDYAREIQKTTDGGYITIGFSNSADNDVTGSHGGEDCWVVKMDASGTVQWQKSLGGSSDDKGSSIKQTTDGGYIIVGSTSSLDGDVTENKGMSDYWVIKLDPSGNIQWQKTYGSSQEDQGLSVAQTTDGGYVAAGTAGAPDEDVIGNHSNDFWILKLNSLGNIQWQKSIGGSGYEYLKTIQQTTDNGYIITGWLGSNDGDAIGGHGNDDYWVIKLDSSGNIQWKKALGGSGNDYSMDIKQTTDGGYIAVGTSNSTDGDVTGNHGDSDYWVVKMDSSGNMQWQKSFGTSNEDVAMSVQQTTDGGYAVAGYSNQYSGFNIHGTNYWIIKLNSTGTLLWEKTLGGSARDEPVSIQETGDGGLIIGGYSASSDGDLTSNNGKVDYWVVKLGSSLTLGTSEASKSNSLSFYPNPAKELVYVDHLPTESTISITDLSGRKLFSEKYNNIKVSINIAQFINGTYIIQVENQGKIILSEKLLINK
ncbi:T9SS C-terminal target domain-containing protein [Chryseobacterium elymi]|uniref:T9SS C-terminal target domain-containing protein n=1 Tax=Chryseobacterium elymi TaxID=395936 RepID=A0A3D9D7R5_9FLAO|nr:T9SS type A sorting domain-containing protein [Chryseobacterium elymi]REC74050.1 T9SS C-terminal target domain-containing protein [Chryseobacterium elymi]